MREDVTGGSYCCPLHSRKLGVTISGVLTEPPKEWILGLDVKNHLTSSACDARMNKFKVAYRQFVE